MTQTGFCDSGPLLDLHKKAEERRPPLRTWANTRGPKERRSLADCSATPDCRWARRVPVSAEDGIIMGYAEQDGSKDGREEEALLQCLHSLPGLRILVPGLLHREMELAMEKLGLIHDRTYAWDMFSDMMRSQAHYTFRSTELPHPFTDSTRAIVVDWLIQVHEMFNFSEETLYLTVHLLNRAMRQIKVSISKLQLLGVVCLFLAGKKEECLLPEISELCFLMDNSYSKRQLLRMERRVLCELDFELSHCPPLHFLLLTASIAHCSDQVVWMARYLLELSLLENQFVVFQPVQLASAALCLARLVLQEAHSPESEAAWCIATSLHICSEPTLQRIMHSLAVTASRAQGRETRASFVKFSTAKTLHVSAHLGLQSCPYLLGPAGAPAWPQACDGPLKGMRAGETGQHM
ncbi:cyclin N-terminal domain-containing protein 2 [Conger conger]|uniref:cyclin N-terminal domain-containing protein 2 n=1 Tax=Conger conger TaxID=82655 RepID=UPI002A5A999D|nr:cyclin N-terminal domain-containing protein 2 [Conger conger]